MVRLMPTLTPDPDGRSNPLEGASFRSTRPLSLDELREFVDAVLAGMAENRDVKWDEQGKPLATLKHCGQDPECTWLFYEVDMSAIGMPTDTPLIVHSYAGEADLEWTIGPTPLARTTRDSTPEQAAAALDMHVLLDGFRRFVLADSVLFPTSLTNDAGRQSGPILIAPEDGCCCECGGMLEVTGVDDATMSVECENGHAYDLEHDAFDVGFDYVLEYLSRRGSD
ncbi:hypothetical protein [Tautonia sociabilis]|uniref:Uncharacterized protein n=1 Tax=Tautonia sociabilis TaxID=2080755 RepID=A0A432ML70_9BACT|nr:hypothetical protein [Tautonia sociabilis]RUL88009.1 hypothetical protein TsocGM_09820 [Tautonia sociabilis]